MSAHTKRRRQAVRFNAAAVKDGQAKIPTRALRFDAGVELADKPATDGTVPITVRARSGGVVNHWYFGRIVHDFAGMRLASDQLPIDYCHDEKEVLGFTDQVDTSAGELVVSGVLLPIDEKDRATEVATKSKLGFRYQASIYFDAQDLVLEFVPEGFSAEVNGGQVEGPIVIARQWVLRGNAICPYGQDPNTSVQFSKSRPGDLVAVTFSEPSPMTKKTSKPAPNRHDRRKAAALSAKGGKPKTQLSKPSPKPAGKSKTKFEAGGDEEDEEDAGQQSDEDEEGQQDEDPGDAGDAGDEETDCDCPEGEECDCDDAGAEDEPVDEMEADEEEGQQTKHSAKKGTPKPAPKTKLSGGKKPKLSDAAAEVKKFVTAFGPQGGVWFSEGKTFAEAQTLFTKGLTETNGELARKVAEQAAMLSALRGEEPVSADPAETKKTKHAAPTNGLTAGQSKFAASIQVPK